MSKTIQLHDLFFNPYIDEATILQKVQAMGAKLAKEYAGQQPIFLAILNGSYVFAADLLRACEIDHEVSFIKLTSYEGTSSTGKVTTQIGLSEDVKGRDVIILEDIIDTGNTIYNFLPTIAKAEPNSVSTVSLLLKPAALQYPLTLNHIGFEIPNKFVVGYGLDYNGLGRNLRSIYQLRE